MDGGGFIVEEEHAAPAPLAPPPAAAAAAAAPRRWQSQHDPAVDPAQQQQHLSGGRNASGCERCGSLTFSQEWFNAFGVVMCNQCKREEKLITKTTAKEVYLVTDKELQGLGSISKSNPQHKQWTAMKLFLEAQVREVALRRHGDMAQLEEERHSRIEAKLAKRAARRREEQEQERKEEEQLERVKRLAERALRKQEEQAAVRKSSVLDAQTGRLQQVFTVGETEVDVEEI